MSPAFGTERTPLTTNGSCAGQSEPRSGYVVKEQCSFRRMESTSPDGSDDLVSSWQGRGRPLRLRRQLSLPNLFFQSSGMLWPTIGPTPIYMPSLRSPCYPWLSCESGKQNALSSSWPPSGGTKSGFQR